MRMTGRPCENVITLLAFSFTPMISLLDLHPWNLTPREAIALQKKLGQEIREVPLPANYPTRLIAGLDVSCTRFDPILTAGVVVWDSETNTIVETASAKAEGTYPYIPGLLSFREIPVLREALLKLQTVPDVFFVDGQGRAHPRRIGIASHIGLLLDRPTVGVGKSRLTGTYADLGSEVGDQSALLDGDEEIGCVIRTKARSNPLFISAGYKINLEDSLRLVTAALRGYKLPEPTRLAHLFVNAVRTGKEEAWMQDYQESEPSLF
jgi:deoxyribonuclease V